VFGLPRTTEKCPTCGTSIKKQKYTNQIDKMRMSYSKECLNLIDHSIAEIDKHRNIKLSETDVYAFMTQIKDCDSDMVIMAINNFIKADSPKEGKGIKYLAAIINNNNSTKTAKKRHEFLTMDRIPPKVE
tara:strand:- start:781 stop:1170 length:390 start_codon:yes stop_codon:yes gene_type:complete